MRPRVLPSALRGARAALLPLLAAFPLAADPVWKAPETLPVGQLSVLELREMDPSRPPLPRPGEGKLGPLDLRSVDPTPDGRGWKLTVQPFVPGIARIPPMDLGDGRMSPELRVRVPRTVPYGAPWVGVGGGQEDLLPLMPFPWAWASLLLLPLGGLGALLAWRWRRGARGRALHHARRAFHHAWPPERGNRASLDKAHAAGRELLALHFGPEARSWGEAAFRERNLEVWATWTLSLDAARFALADPPFPPGEALLKALEARGPRKQGDAP